MRKIVFSALLFSAYGAMAQNVGINATGAAPVSSAALDVDMANKGVLVPRVALATTSSFSPVTGTATVSLLVYNTATAGISPSNVTPGYYYWNGTAWVRLINSGNSWELLGNQGTTQGTNFLGTTDNVGVDFRTNNILRQRIFNTGETVFNNAATNSGDILATYGTGTNNALFTSLSGTGNGVASYTLNSSTGAGGLSGFVALTGSGYNLYARNATTTNYNPAVLSICNMASGDGVVGYTGAGTAYTSYASGSGGTFAHTARGVFGVASATNGTGGAFAGQGNAPTALLAGSGASVSGKAAGLAVIATTTTNSVGAYFAGNDAAWNGPATGGAGIGVTSTNIATWPSSTGTATNTWGGYFQNGNTYAYVGGTLAGINYKINGPGTVSTIVPDLQGKSVNMFCPEAPEVLFQDYGTGKLVNGKAHIVIDPVLAKNIFVDETHPLKVFIQMEGECRGVFVSNKSAAGFDVTELQSGNSNVAFSWSLVANRINTTNENGEVTSAFQTARFPESPLRSETKVQEREDAIERKVQAPNVPLR